MPNTINLRLLENKNIIAELNGIPLATENSYKIVAGEKNATKFRIASKPLQYKDAIYTVELINSKGYGVKIPNLATSSDKSNETILVNDEFSLPEGMAVAGYGYIIIRAYLGEEIVPFVGLKVKVWNTLPNWKEFTSGVVGGGSGGGITNITEFLDDTLKDNNKAAPAGIVGLNLTALKNDMVEGVRVRSVDFVEETDEGNTYKFEFESKSGIDDAYFTAPRGNQGVQGETGYTAKVVSTEFIGKTDEGDFRYKQTFDDGSTNIFETPRINFIFEPFYKHDIRLSNDSGSTIVHIEILSTKDSSYTFNEVIDYLEASGATFTSNVEWSEGSTVSTDEYGLKQMKMFYPLGKFTVDTDTINYNDYVGLGVFYKGNEYQSTYKGLFIVKDTTHFNLFNTSLNDKIQIDKRELTLGSKLTQIYAQQHFKIGSTGGTDLSNYYTIPEVDEKIANIEGGGEGGTSTDVQINGVSITENGVANIPIADGSKVGVHRLGAGLKKAGTDMAVTDKATDDMIKAGTDNYRPIVSASVDYAVKKGLIGSANKSQTDTNFELGDADKESVRNWLGVPPKANASSVPNAGNFIQYYNKANAGAEPTIVYQRITTSAVGSSIPQRMPSGQISVGTPTADDHATPKKYVDDAIAGVSGGGGGSQLYLHQVPIHFTGFVDASIPEFTLILNVLSSRSTAYGSETSMETLVNDTFNKIVSLSFVSTEIQYQDAIASAFIVSNGAWTLRYIQSVTQTEYTISGSVDYEGHKLEIMTYTPTPL